MSLTFQTIREQLGGWLWLIVLGVIGWEIFVFVLAAKSLIAGDFPLFLFFLPFLGGSIYVEYVRRKVRKAFWQQLAATNGWSYEADGDVAAEAGLMFHQGHSQNIFNVITGNFDGRKMRIFTFHFATGSGKQRRDYYYTVYEFTFAGQFPHLNLNSLLNMYGVAGGVKLPLPAEFEKFYRLTAPEEYEIEALQVFTPDILAYLIDRQLPYDVELVNQEMLIYVKGQVNDLQQLEQDYARACDFAQRMAPTLDKMRFAEIPQHPSVLTR